MFAARLLAGALASVFYRVRAVGAERVPARGPVLLVANHVSFIDAFLIGLAAPRPVRFLMLRAYYDLPLIGRLFRALGCIPVSSDDGPKALVASFKRAREYMMSGEAVCIFAEGEISRHGQMQRFKRGFESMVHGVEVPIVPVHLDELWGSLFSFSGGRLLFKRLRRLPYHVTVSFGKPLPGTANAFTVRQAILELGAEAFRHRLEGERPLPLSFLRRVKESPFAPCVADSMGTRLNGLSALTGAHLLGARLARAAGAAERVGIFLPPTAAAVLANAGLSLHGKVPVNLNYTTSKDVVDACCAKADITAVVTSRRFVEKLGWAPSARPIFVEDIAAGVGAVEKAAAAALLLLSPSFALERLLFGAARGGLDRPATVLFTSGSTGLPKGVVLTHANVLSNILAIGQVLPLSREDLMIGVLPFFHAFGYMGTLWLPLCLGVPSAQHFNPLDARGVGELCAEHGGTLIVATPTFLQGWMRRIEPAQFKTLKWVVVGAEKLRDEVAAAFEAKYGLAPLEGYGATELSPAASINIPDIAWPGIRQTGTKRGTVGQPLPGVFMKVVDAETGLEKPSGEPGLLLVKGPGVMSGYLDDPELTRAVLRDGYYDTGDVARIDEDGFVTLTDRLSRFSKVGGEMVPHIKIEESLQEASGLVETSFAVAGVPDDKRGERLVVLYKGAVDLDAALKKLAGMGLPNLWLPAKANFHKVAEFPLLGSGKTDLQALKAEARRLDSAA